MHLKMALRWPILSLFFLATFTTAEKITLDANSDLAKEWFDISCIYTDDPTEMWVYGCSPDFYPTEDVFPTRRGFWAPCIAQKCEINFHGGRLTPQAKSIDLSLYAKGDVDVVVSSKHGLLDEYYNNEVGRITLRGARGWFQTALDLTEQKDALYLKFTLSLLDPYGSLLIDKIEIDLGEDGRIPPEDPTTTTPRPIQENIVTLDKDSDYWVIWNRDCNYVDQYNDMWAYGCPASAKMDNANITSEGFWTPCLSHKCKLQYVAKPYDIRQPIPTQLTVNAYLEGKAKIYVRLQQFPLDYLCMYCKQLGVIEAPENSNGDWVEKIFDTGNILSNDFRLNFELVKQAGAEGSVFLDKISLTLKDQQPPDGGQDGDEYDPNSGTMSKMGWISLGLPIMISIIFLSLK